MYNKKAFSKKGKKTLKTLLTFVHRLDGTRHTPNHWMGVFLPEKKKTDITLNVFTKTVNDF